MDEEFIKCLKECDTYEDVVELVDQAIDLEIETSKSNNLQYFIGYYSESEDKKYLMSDNNYFNIIYNPAWNGFIDENVRITFGGFYNGNGELQFDGNYYYMDTRDFIYDFCYQYKDYEFIDVFELICLVKLSMDSYFSSFTFFNEISRNKMLLPLSMKISGEKVYNHNFSDFKGKNNARCTERAAFANNLLSVYGVGTCMALGKVVRNGKKTGHAFNFVDMDGGLALVDFSICSDVYDPINKNTMKIPFVHDMGEDKNRLSEMANTFENILCPSYYSYLYGDYMYSFCTGKARVYNIGDLGPTKKVETPRILLKTFNENAKIEV